MTGYLHYLGTGGKETFKEEQRSQDLEGRTECPLPQLLKERRISVLNMINIRLLKTCQPIKQSLENKGCLRNKFNLPPLVS